MLSVVLYGGMALLVVAVFAWAWRRSRGFGDTAAQREAVALARVREGGDPFSAPADGSAASTGETMFAGLPSQIVPGGQIDVHDMTEVVDIDQLLAGEPLAVASRARARLEEPTNIVMDSDTLPPRPAAPAPTAPRPAHVSGSWASRASDHSTARQASAAAAAQRDVPAGDLAAMPDAAAKSAAVNQALARQAAATQVNGRVLAAQSAAAKQAAVQGVAAREAAARDAAASAAARVAAAKEAAAKVGATKEAAAKEEATRDAVAKAAAAREAAAKESAAKEAAARAAAARDAAAKETAVKAVAAKEAAAKEAAAKEAAAKETAVREAAAKAAAARDAAAKEAAAKVAAAKEAAAKEAAARAAAARDAAARVTAAKEAAKAAADREEAVRADAARLAQDAERREAQRKADDAQRTEAQKSETERKQAEQRMAVQRASVAAGPKPPARGAAPEESPDRTLPLRELALAWFEARGYRGSPASAAVRPIELVLRHKDDSARAYAFVVETERVSADRVLELRTQARSIGLPRVLIVASAGADPDALEVMRKKGVRLMDRAALDREFSELDFSIAAKIIAIARKRAAVRSGADSGAVSAHA